MRVRVGAVGDTTNDWPKSPGQPLSTQWSTSCGVLCASGLSNERTLFRGVCLQLLSLAGWSSWALEQLGRRLAMGGRRDHPAVKESQTQTTKNTERFVYSIKPAQSSAASKRIIAAGARARRNGPSSSIAHQAQCFKRASSVLQPIQGYEQRQARSHSHKPLAFVHSWPDSSRCSLLVAFRFSLLAPPSRPFLHLSPRSLLPSSAASASSTCSCCLDQLTLRLI